MTPAADVGSARVDQAASAHLSSLRSADKKALVMDTPPDDEQSLRSGTEVDVFSRFSAAWVSGFEIAATLDGGYQLRRLSDHSVLPATFVGHDLRRRHQQQR